MDIKKVIQAIGAVTDRDELNQVSAALRAQYNHLSHMAALSFLAGDSVYFIARRGRRLDGTVMKVNRKTVTVRTTDGMVWKVGPSLLRRN